MNLADHGAGGLGQQVHVDRVARGQVENELLVGRTGHPVGLIEIHGEEFVRHMVPERASPVGGEDAPQLGQDGVGEQVRLGPDQHVARLAQQSSRAALASVRLEEQRADLGPAGAFIDQHQGLLFQLDAERG